MIHTQDSDFTLYQGDCLEILRSLPERSVHCCVTSPPYWGLRDYGAEGQLGLEATPDEYVARMVDVFREVRRVLRDDGTLWLNLGDSYAGSGPSGASYQSETTKRRAEGDGTDGNFRISKTLESRGLSYAEKKPIPPAGWKPKDMVGIPWRVAFALQADGWWLRSDIIWSKPNPMPESVTDRPTKAHEYVFLLSKSPRYFFDQEAVQEELRWTRENNPDWNAQRAETNAKKHPTNRNAQSGGFAGWQPTRPDTRPQEDTLDGSNGEAPRGPDGRRATTVQGGDGSIQHRDGERWPNGGRNVRSVWEIATQPYAEAHFATFPQELPRRCIAAGSPIDGVVLDPFAGSGTTNLVARNLGRRSIGIELNGEYCDLAARRLQQLSLLT